MSCKQPLMENLADTLPGNQTEGPVSYLPRGSLLKSNPPGKLCDVNRQSGFFFFYRQNWTKKPVEPLEDRDHILSLLPDFSALPIFQGLWEKGRWPFLKRWST